MSKKEFGQRSEDRVARLLRDHGMDVLARNIRINSVEVDLIARYFFQSEAHVTLFEIKCVQESHFLSGYPVVSERQRQRYLVAVDGMLKRAGQFFNVHCGLIVLDKSGKLLYFNPFSI